MDEARPARVRTGAARRATCSSPTVPACGACLCNVRADSFGDLGCSRVDARVRSPDGVQLKVIRDFLRSSKGKKFKTVWIDAQCMPQDQPRGTRTAADTAAFKTMLAQINSLFLGTSVLILLDLSYVSRFCECRPACDCNPPLTPFGRGAAAHRAPLARCNRPSPRTTSARRRGAPVRSQGPSSRRG